MKIQTDEEVGLPPNLVIDDNEPIYDRLGETGGGGMSKIPRSPTQSQRSGNFRRVKGPHNRAIRESVLNLADDLMERRHEYVPIPMEHTVSEVDIKSPIQLTTSEQIPDRKPHTAALLGPHHRRTGSHDLVKKDSLGGVRKPAIEVTSPLTPKGIVREKMNMFSYSPSRVLQQSRGGGSGSGNTPMRALVSTLVMTKSNIPVKTETKIPTSGSGGGSVENTRGSNIRMRSGSNKKVGKSRPASFDVSLLLNNERNVSETSNKDDSCEAGIFDRNVQIRTAFRKKSHSREPTPELDDEEETTAVAAGDFTQPLPRSPTTGALISGGGGGDETEVFIPSQESPGLDELSVGVGIGIGIGGEKQLSQNTSSQGSRNTQGSQDSVRKNPKMTVRERTKKWEARGGGLPSYFSTLPKSFRHKATDPRQDPAYMHALQSPTGEEQAFFAEDEEAIMRKISYASKASSKSGIPLPTSKLRAPRGMSSSGGRGGSGGGQSTGHDKSVSPGRGDEGEEIARSVNSSGQYPSSNESSLERRMGIGKDEGERPSAGKGRGFVGKGSHLPMRSSGLQVRMYVCMHLDRCGCGLGGVRKSKVL